MEKFNLAIAKAIVAVLSLLIAVSFYRMCQRPYGICKEFVYICIYLVDLLDSSISIT